MSRTKFLVKREVCIFGPDHPKCLSIPIPDDCDLIVVCKNNGTGHDPVRVLLPHQLYEDDVRKYLKEMEDESTRDLYILPVRSEDTIKVAELIW